MKYVFRKKRYILLASLLDGVGYFILWLLRPRKPHLNQNFKNILIVRMDHLGDVLLATGVPKLIKENFPGVRVNFLTSSWAAPLLEGNPFVDEVIVFDAPWFRRKNAPKGAHGLGFFGLIRHLKEKCFDLGIALRGDLRENLILRLAGVRERIGYGITGGGFFLTKEGHYRERIHERDRAANLLRPLGVRTESLKPRIYFTADEESCAEKILAASGLGGFKKLIGFQWGAGTVSKDWPVELAIDFLRRFGSKFPDFKIVLVGNLSGKKDLEEICRRFPYCVNLVGKTSLRELCALIKKFIFFIGADSGPTHIASVLSVPSIFLFSGTNRFEEWRPLAEGASVLRHPVDCSPCGLKVCVVPGHPCMSGIRPEEVLNLLEERLKAGAGIS